MAKLLIEGGRPLEGDMEVHGAKNAVLPILAATVLNGGKSVIYNCPDLKDVDSSIDILRYLGCHVSKHDDVLTIDSASITYGEIPEKLMHEMRSSVIFLGATVSRLGRVVTSMPGGCELGPRPIDLHLKAFRQLGINIEEDHGYITCQADRIVGANIHLDFPSVGATENIMLAATLAQGTTIITNAAKEPEIADLQKCLNAMGARVSGAGTSIVRIDGVKKLHDMEHVVMPDRIVAATYLACSAIAGGMVELKHVEPSHLEAVFSVMRQCGSKLYIRDDSIVHIAPERLMAVDTIRTQPYPGFPTDAQSPLMAALTIADGTSIFIENIFESRFKHVIELCRMGADITVDGRMAVVRGVSKLSGAKVSAMDLRGGAALVVAALAAEGTTQIDNIYHIDRGYANLTEVLSGVGARIKRE